MSRTEKPLFIPLKRKFFEAFRDGKKDTEYRKYGVRWNQSVCWPGRSVILSLGYGKGNRLTGVITKFDRHNEPALIDGWIECYGHAPEHVAACIGIRLDANPSLGGKRGELPRPLGETVSGRTE